MARPKSDNVQINISIPSEWKKELENLARIYSVAKLDRERGGSDFATAPFGFIFPWPSASGRGLSGGFPETGRLR